VIDRKLQNLISWVVSIGILAAGIFGYFAGDLSSYMFPTRMFLDGNHFMISAAVLVIGIWFYLEYEFVHDKPFRLTALSVFLLIAILSGFLMLLKLEFIETLSHLSYTFYDLSLVGILVMCIYYMEQPHSEDDQIITTAH
jgi:phosphatidylserine synthase